MREETPPATRSPALRISQLVTGIGFAWKNHFFLFSAGTDLVEALDGAGELAIEADFVATEDVEPAGAIGEGGLGGHVLERVGAGLFADFVGNGGVFEDPDTYQTPAADHHGLDQAALGGGLGLEFGDESIVKAEAPIKGASQGVEAFGGFTIK
jgi:hypothetical protein